MRVHVLGGTGALGAAISERLRSAGHVATASGREVDVTDIRAVGRALTGGPASGVDAVVCAAPGSVGAVQQACAAASVPSVDVSPRYGQALVGAERAARASGTPHLVATGMFPGLSGVVAAEFARPRTPLELRLVQSGNARVGAAGVREMLRWVADGAGAVRRDGSAWLRLASAEADALAAEGLDVRMLTRWDDRAQSVAIASLRRTGALRPLLGVPDAVLARMARHSPDRPESVELSAHDPHRGIVWAARARGDYAATAAVAVAAAARLERLPAGVHRPWQCLDLGDVLTDVADVVTVLPE